MKNKPVKISFKISSKGMKEFRPDTRMLAYELAREMIANGCCSFSERLRSANSDEYEFCFYAWPLAKVVDLP